MTAGRVALARRNLFEDRRRAVLAIVGVGAGLLMVLLMSGIFAGMTRQETAYIDRSPASVLVSQADVHTMQMSTSALPTDTVAKVAAVPGVAWAEGLRQSTSTIAAGDTHLISYVFGYDPATQHGGPQVLAAGRPPAAGDVVIDAAGAAQLHVGIGDTVSVFGVPLHVSGLTEGLTSVANTTVFITAEQYAQAAGPGPNYVIVGAAPGVDDTTLSARIAAAVPEVTVQTRAGFAEQETQLVQDMYADVIKTMNGIGFVIALALVALTLSTITAANLREYGIVKALGGTRRELTRIVATQAVWAVLAAMVVATALAVALAALIDAVVPNIELIIEPRSVLMTGLGALVIGAPAALLPLRRVVSVDPATAFRAPS